MASLVDRLPKRIDYEGVVGNDIVITSQWYVGPAEDNVPFNLTAAGVTVTALLQNSDGTDALYQFAVAPGSNGLLVITIQEENTALLGQGRFYWTVDVNNNDLVLTTIGGELRMYTRVQSIGEQA